MRSIPFLALVGVLGILLTACPGGGPGPSFDFNGTYRGTVSAREARHRPEAWRGLPGTSGTFTVELTQTGMTVSGTFAQESRIVTTATISAMVSQPGVAAGIFTVTGNRGPTAFSITLFLTANRDLVIHFPTAGGIVFFFERQ